MCQTDLTFPDALAGIPLETMGCASLSTQC